MKLTTDRKTLGPLLKHCAEVAKPDNHRPVLGCVKITADEGGALRLEATDLEMGLRAKTMGKVARGGSVCVAAKRLSEIVARLSGDEVEIELGCTHASKLNVRAGRAVFKLVTYDADAFPTIPTTVEGEALTLKAEDLRDAVTRAAYAASKDEHRPAMTGVLFQPGPKGLELVATDGHRLAWLKTSHAVGFSERFLLPALSLRELVRVAASRGEVRLGVSAEWAMMEAGPVQVFSRVIDAPYPSFEAVVPQSFAWRLRFAREALSGALARVAHVTDGRMEIEPQAGAVTLRAAQSSAEGKGAEVTHDVDTLETEGEAPKLAVSLPLLGAAVGAVQGDVIELRGNDALTPMVCAGDGDDVHVVMPMN